MPRYNSDSCIEDSSCAAISTIISIVSKVERCSIVENAVRRLFSSDRDASVHPTDPRVEQRHPTNKPVEQSTGPADHTEGRKAKNSFGQQASKSLQAAAEFFVLTEKLYTFVSVVAIFCCTLFGTIFISLRSYGVVSPHGHGMHAFYFCACNHALITFVHAVRSRTSCCCQFYYQLLYSEIQVKPMQRDNVAH